MRNAGLESCALAHDVVGIGAPVVFGHSFLWSSQMWAPQVDHLKERYQCITPELWGHGRVSQLPESVGHLTDVADTHAKLLEELTLEPCALVGLSVGGMWATQLALDHPKKVKALVLMGTSVAPEPEDSKLRYLSMLSLVEQVETLPSIIIEQIAPLFFSPYTMANRQELVEDFKIRLAQIDRQDIEAIVSIGRQIFMRKSLMNRLGELEIPVLIMVGADDRSRPVRESEAMVERIPNARLAVIPQAGHVCNLEQPKRVNSILSEFLDDAF